MQKLNHTNLRFGCPNCKQELGFFYNPDEIDKRELYCPRINCQFSTIYSDEYLSALDHYKKFKTNINDFEFIDNNSSITHSSVTTNTEIYTEPTIQTAAANNKTYTLSLDKVIGFTDIKDLLQNSVNSQRPTHILLCSPPSVAKTYLLTSMLEELSEQGANTLYRLF